MTATDDRTARTEAVGVTGHERRLRTLLTTLHARTPFARPLAERPA